MLIGYARVSTADQELTLQREALERAGCEKLFTDKASGAKVDRPGLAEALVFTRGGDTLFIWTLDQRPYRAGGDLVGATSRLSLADGWLRRCDTIRASVVRHSRFGVGPEVVASRRLSLRSWIVPARSPRPAKVAKLLQVGRSTLYRHFPGIQHMPTNSEAGDDPSFAGRCPSRREQPKKGFSSMDCASGLFVRRTLVVSACP